jgi:hypothetical protein
MKVQTTTMGHQTSVFLQQWRTKKNYDSRQTLHKNSRNMVQWEKNQATKLNRNVDACVHNFILNGMIRVCLPKKNPVSQSSMNPYSSYLTLLMKKSYSYSIQLKSIEEIEYIFNLI